MASEDAVGKMKNRRQPESSKPYSRRKSIVGRVTDAMKDMISPSWLVDLVSTIKKKTPPLQASTSQQPELEASHVQHRYQPANEAQHDPVVRPGMSPQPVFPPPMPQMTPLVNSGMGPHPIHQIPTPVCIPTVSASVPVQFTSESMSYMQQKSAQKNTQSVIVNGADGQSEFSEFSVSTRGSMLPHTDKNEYQKEVLLMNEARIRQLRQELGGSITPSKEIEAKSIAEAHHTTAKDEKTFLWSGGSPLSKRMPQPPAMRQTPGFNVNLFGGTPTQRHDETKSDFLSSPFYPGKTRFGGAASADRRGRLKETRQMAPTRKQVVAKPLVSAGGSPVTSSAAKRILDALDKMSSPLNDVRRIPSYNSNYANSPLSFTPSSYKRRRGETGRHRTEGPPTHHVVTPTRASIAPNLQRPGSGLNVRQQPAARGASNTEEVHAPGAEYPTPVSRGGKMKRERGGLHYSSKPEESEEVIVPQLPTEFTLPVNSMPTFSFEPNAPSGKLSLPTPTPGSPDAFTFRSPITQTSPGVSVSSPVSPTSFQFSSPISVDKSRTVQPPVSSQGHPKSANATTTPQAPSLSFCFNPATARKKPTTAESPVPNNTNMGGVKVANTLSGSSVMDFLKKSPISSSPLATSMRQDNAVASVARNTPSTSMKEVAGGSNSLTQLFKKPTGAWECPTCMIQNQGDASKCPACETPKPGAKPPTAVMPSQPQMLPPVKAGNSLASLFQKSAGSWECPTCMVSNKSEHSKCPACETPRPGGSGPTVSQPPKVHQPDIPKPTGPSLVDLFKKPTGTWDCDTCMVTNKSDDTKCIACEMPKPGCKATTSFTSPGGFKIGPTGGFTMSSAATTVTAGNSTGGFSFGSSAAKSTPAATSTTSAAPGVGFKFQTDKPSEEKKAAPALAAPGGFQFGNPSAVAKSKTATVSSDNNNKSGYSGFKFGDPTEKSGDSVVPSKVPDVKEQKPAPSVLAAGGFKFGETIKNSEKPVVKAAPSVDKPQANTAQAAPTGGFVFGQTVNDTKSDATDAAGKTAGFSFGSVSSGAKPAVSQSTKTIGAAPSSGLGAQFSFGSSSALKTPSESAKAESQKDAAPKVASLGGAGTTAPTTLPAFSFGTKPELTSSSGFSKPATASSSGIVFGAASGTTAPAAATSTQNAATSFVFGSTTDSKTNISENAPPAQAPGAGLFTFGKSSSQASSSSANKGMFQFGGANSDNKAPALGTVNAPGPSGTVAPFTFGAPKSNQETTMPVFGQKRSQPEEDAQGPAKRGRDLGGGSYAKSTSTPAFGSGNSSMGSGNSSMTFGSGTTSVPSFNPPPYNPPPMSTAPPAFQFGATPASNPAAPAGVFQFGAPKTDLPSVPAPSNPGFNFGQAAAPANGQSGQNAGFNFGANAGPTPSFNFTGGNTQSPAAPAFHQPQAAPAPAFHQPQAAPAPAFHQPQAGQAPAPGFQFGAAQPAANSNPFNATGAPGKSRPVRRAVRKLKK